MNSLLDFDNNLLHSNSDASVNLRQYVNRIKKEILPDFDADQDPIPMGIFYKRCPEYSEVKSGYAS